jgi:hypothetical protein
MPEPDLDALTALEAAATPGPWEADKVDDIRAPGGRLIASVDWDGWDRNQSRQSTPDAALICAARNALPGLLAEVRRLTAEVVRVTGERDDAIQMVADLTAQLAAQAIDV